METLNAVYRVKHELGLKTVLGVSNISFGLPNRVLVNHIFLTMALQNGLDLPIINPNIPEMTGAVRAYKLLANIDKNSVDYIKAYANMPKVEKSIRRQNRQREAQVRQAVRHRRVHRRQLYRQVTVKSSYSMRFMQA